MQVRGDRALIRRLLHRLVSLHHRMEHWITNMLVSKNNQVRLEAAGRTIEELEGAGDGGSAT